MEVTLSPELACATLTHTHTLAKLLEYLHGASPSCATNWTIIESSEFVIFGRRAAPWSMFCDRNLYLHSCILTNKTNTPVLYRNKNTHRALQKKKTVLYVQENDFNSYFCVFGNNKEQLLKSRLLFWIQIQIFFLQCAACFVTCKTNKRVSTSVNKIQRSMKVW